MRPLELRPIWLVLLAGLAGLPRPGWSQSGSYLRPAAFAGRVGDNLRMQLFSGGLTDGTPVAWPAANVDWMLVRAAGTQRNLHDPAPLAADVTSIVVPLEHAGAAMIGADVTWPVRTVSAGDLERLRTVAGASESDGTNAAAADGPSKEPANAGLRLRHVDSSKVLVRGIGEDGEPPAAGLAESKSGQVAEIRPLADPLGIKLGSDLPLRVYLHGSSRGAARVTVTHADGTSRILTTNPSGIAHFQVNKPGVWMVECWHVEPAPPGGADFDWASFRSTITFEVQGGPQ